MQEMQTVTTDVWELKLPNDWREREPTKGNAVYFESPDESKGLYVTTWHVGDSQARSPLDVAESFKRIDMDGLRGMVDHDWQVVEDSVAADQTTAVLVSDYLAAERNYRIVTKIVARPPVVVRASFQDYLCEQHDRTRAYFSAMLSSVELL